MFYISLKKDLTIWEGLLVKPWSVLPNQELVFNAKINTLYKWLRLCFLEAGKKRGGGGGEVKEDEPGMRQRGSFDQK